MDAKYCSFLRTEGLFISKYLGADGFAFTQGRGRGLLLVFLLEVFKGQV